jgi:formiminotetrahydrofolate cyclodeaminase
MQFLRELIEYIAGERDLPPEGAPAALSSVLARSLTWMLFLLLIYLFSGQSSKFMYIDF